jgi:peptidoglycan/LPS O-acetylase OafA/YrhL
MERDRIAELDLLRFTAAASVVLFHVTHWPTHGENLLTATFAYGFMGVPLFFMISGFVILMTAQSRTGIEFINSRIARLYPSFWICVLLSSLALAVLAHRPPSLQMIATNLTMQPHAFDQPYIDQVYWTLVVEMKFYALMWLLIVTRQMKRVEFFLTLWLALGALAAFVELPGWLDSLLIPTWASLFSAGCFLYLIRSRGATRRRLITLAVSVALSMYYVAQLVSAYTDTVTLEMQLITAAICLAMSVVFLLLALRKWSMPRSRLWLWLGCLTYPLYLTHAQAGRQVWARLGGDEWSRIWVALALVLLVSIILAVVVERRACPAFHRLLDRTAQRLLEKLGRGEDRATAMR